MNKSRIYIGNLAYSTTEDSIRTYFSQYGEISEVKLISDHHTGRSKGFGFITFANEQDAEASLKADGVEFEDRQLKVNIAKERAPRTGGAGGGGGRRAGGNARGGRDSNW